ncbi:hypothetical protein MMC17_000502 [Xylographa soralifera]|nr:hypothetical protein [Xylographa soralifera]
MVQQCVIVGSVVGTICGVLMLALFLAAGRLLYDRRSRILPEEPPPPPTPPRSHIQVKLDNFITPFYSLESDVDKDNTVIETFYEYSMPPNQISKAADSLRFFHVLRLYPPRPFDESHLLEVMRSFGHVPGQEAPENLLKLLKSKKNGEIAILHFVYTTLISSIMLESRHVQLLCPPVAFFFLYANTAQPKSRKFELNYTYSDHKLTDFIGPSYHKDIAQLRKLMVKVLPYPNAGPARGKLKAYMMEVLRPFYTDEEHLGSQLEQAMQEYADFGNILLLESTSWEWDYSYERPDPCLALFPAFRQVRDAEGKPTQGRFDREAFLVHRHDE